jgi:hypothetical protein
MFSKTKPPTLSAYIWIIFGACLLALLATGIVGLRALDAHDKATSRMHERWIARPHQPRSAGLMDNRNELTLLVQHSSAVLAGPHDVPVTSGRCAARSPRWMPSGRPLATSCRFP